MEMKGICGEQTDSPHSLAKGKGPTTQDKQVSYTDLSKTLKLAVGVLFNDSYAPGDAKVVPENHVCLRV